MSKGKCIRCHQSFDWDKEEHVFVTNADKIGDIYICNKCSLTLFDHMYYNHIQFNVKKCCICQKQGDFDALIQIHGKGEGYIPYWKSFCSKECYLKACDQHYRIWDEDNDTLEQKIEWRGF